MFVAEVYTGRPGRYVGVKDTVRGFLEILDGKWDHLPEQAFYMVGDHRRGAEQAEKMEKRRDRRRKTRTALSCDSDACVSRDVAEQPLATVFVRSIETAIGSRTNATE